MLDDIRFIDCNCAIGRYAAPPMPDLPHTVPQILETLDYSGIDSAIVYHIAAWEYDPESGNRFLMEELVGESRLLPQWVILPHHTGEFPPPRELLDTMVSQGVLTARMFPSEKAGPPEEAGHNFSLASWSAGPLLSEMEERRMPLFIARSQISWDQVHDLCSTYSDLPLVLSSVPQLSFRANRHLWPLWSIHKNLYVDTSDNEETARVERVVESFGPERLLFGTGLPRFAPGAHVVSVARARISTDAKKLIASQNLERLLENVKK